MKLNMWHFDWVQYTVRGSGPVSEDSLQRAFFNDPFSSLLNYVPEFIKPFLSESDFFLDKGINGYTFSYSCSSGFSVFFGNPDNVSMGINFRFSGSFLSRILPTLDDDFLFAKWLYNAPSDLALKGYKFKLTRLDFAFDCNKDFSYFVDSFDKGQYRCAARSNIYKVVNKDNRGTIYFGSRQSSKMIRIYDKIQERIDSLTGDDLNDFLDYCNDNNYESITRIEIQCRENHSSPAASKALEQFYYGDIGAFLLSILEFGYYEGYDHNNHPAFIRFDWYEEQILNFVQCGVKVPFVQATDINFEWLVSVFGSQLVTLERQAPDLLNVIRDKASISQSLSKKLKKYQSSVIKFVDRHKNGFDEDIPLSSEDSFFDE